ncbi:MAG: hypothetical protein FWD95_15110 [Nocardioidaceae bacterium]|nr:hypothetical protein [Nocardioidaceae bacterium]
MPTALRRYQVTETPEVARALEIAERRWPGKSRGALLAALAEEGAKSVERDDAARREARRRELEALAGSFRYEAGYLEELRKDWPE